MFEYFFVLGRAFDLCKAELFALLESFDVEIVSTVDHVLLVKSQNSLPLSKIVDRSGGLVKAGIVASGALSLEDMRLFIGDWVAKKFNDSKFRFGVSIYGHENVGKMGQQIAVQLNDDFENRGLKSSYVLPEGSEMSSVQIDKYKLIGQKGVEFVLIFEKELVRLGITEATQPFEVWSKLDFGRPGRDSKSGMLPPKVARMMINMGLGEFKSGHPDWDKEVTVYDPYCGSGTVLSESLRLGCRTGGSDLSDKAVRDTISNIQWLVDSGISNVDSGKIDQFFGYKIFSSKPDDVTVKTSEVAHVHKVVPARSIQIVVTEPYLGPTFGEEPTPGKLDRIIKGLEKMYIGGLNSMKEILVSGGVVVFAEPAYFAKNKTYTVGIIDNPERFGYTLASKIVEYKRDKAFVGRRIAVLVKK